MNLNIKQANKIAGYLEAGKTYSFEEYQGYSFTLCFKDGSYFRDYFDMMNYDGKPSSTEKFTKDEFLAMLCGKPEQWFCDLL